MARRRTRRKRLLKERERTNFSLLPALATPTAEQLQDAAELFLHLCSWTVPHGGEDRYYGPLLTDLGFKQDLHGNWFLEILDGNTRPTTCFMAHLDTASGEVQNILRYVTDDVCFTDGKSILGADDRAGVSIILYMANRDVPGLYYLFIGEEAGCVGSMAAAKMETLPAHILRAISFDRKGTSSIVTHQCSRKCCSREFAWALANELNTYGFTYEPDPMGLFTDSREFADTIPECTNISVGYYDQHSHKERQNLGFLRWLAEVCTKVDWEGLPTHRKPEPEVWDSKGYSGWYDHVYGDDIWDHPKSGYSQDDSTYREYLRDCEDEAYDAIEEIIENFTWGLPTDPRLCEKLVQPKQEDTAAMIEMLLDELQREVFRPSTRKKEG